MSGTVTLLTTLKAPLLDGNVECGVELEDSFTFAQKSIKELSYDGAGSDTIDFGTITDAKMCVIHCTLGAGSFDLNGVASALPVKAGGHLAWSNSQGGLTGLSVTTTGAAKFVVWIYA